METITYSGRLYFANYGESEDVLFLSTVSGPFVEELEEQIGRATVSVRYWVTDCESTKEEANEQFMRLVTGGAIVRFSVSYSETTGYLYTDEDLWVGGHDLAEELRCNEGKWIILEIDIHDD